MYGFQSFGKVGSDGGFIEGAADFHVHVKGFDIVRSRDGFQHVVDVVAEVFLVDVHAERIIEFSINGLSALDGGRNVGKVDSKRFHGDISVCDGEVDFQLGDAEAAKFVVFQQGGEFVQRGIVVDEEVVGG